MVMDEYPETQLDWDDVFWQQDSGVMRSAIAIENRLHVAARCSMRCTVLR